MGTWGAVLLLVLLCVAPALAQTWLQWFMSWMTWFLPPTHEPLHQNGYNNEIKCKNPGRGCGPEQRPLLHGSSGLGYYEPQPNPPAKIKDTSSSNTFHNFPGKRKRRPWPLLTNAGKSKQQIANEEKELEELLEKMRDIRSSRIRNNRVGR